MGWLLLWRSHRKWMCLSLRFDHDCSPKTRLQIKTFPALFDSGSVSNIAGRNGRRRSSHSELLNEELRCCVETCSCCVEQEIRLRLLMARWKKADYWLTFIKTTRACLAVHKVAAQGVFAIVLNCNCCYHGNHRCRQVNQVLNLKDYLRLEDFQQRPC